MTTLLLHLADFNEASWARGFAAALPGVRVVLRSDAYDPAEIDYIFVWKPKPDAFDGLDNLKAVLSLGAGVDALLRHPRLPKGVPVVRFMDADLTQRMSDYVVANVTMHQRLFTRFSATSRRGAGCSSIRPPRGRPRSASWAWACSGRMPRGISRSSATRSGAGAARPRRSKAWRASWAPGSWTPSSPAPISSSTCCR